MGTLYYVNSLDILRRYVADESVDLVYLEPPFNSAQNYNWKRLRTFAELLEDKAVECPPTVAIDETWKRAPKSQPAGHEQTGLGL